MWSAGFLYWHLSIKRAIARVVDPARRLQFASGDNRYSEIPSFSLRGANSRAIPDLLDAIDEAAADRDLELMLCLMRDLSYTVSRADWKEGDLWEVDPSRRIILPIGGLFVEYVLKDHLRNRDWWIRENHNYPPWWKWWIGKRRAR